MRKTTEVLRLRAAGMSARQITRSVGVARSTVAEYCRRADAAGVSWPLPEGMDDDGLDAVLFPKSEPGTSRSVPEWGRVHEDAVAPAPPDAVPAVARMARAAPRRLGVLPVLPALPPLVRDRGRLLCLSYAPGERLFVDPSGDKAAWCNPETGEIHEADVFVAVLGCSGMLYVEATRGQDLASWVTAHVHAWEACQGVSEITVPDNLRAGVTEACLYDPEVNPTDAEAATHSNTVVLPHARLTQRVPTTGRRPSDEAAAGAGGLDGRALGAGAAAPSAARLPSRAARGARRRGGRPEGDGRVLPGGR